MRASLPDVLSSNSAGDLFTSSWFYGEEQKRLFQMAIWKHHGITEVSQIVKMFATKKQYYHSMFIQRIEARVPRSTGHRRVQRCRDHLAYFESLKQKAKDIVEVDLTEEYDADNIKYDCFLRLVSFEPYLHCYKQFYHVP